MAFKFYYDETEHSRKINLKTIRADNFYDNFMTVIIGWDDGFCDEIEKKYLAFEEKYNDRKSKGELKSTTLSQKQFVNGFASMSVDNAEFISDFLAAAISLSSTIQRFLIASTACKSSTLSINAPYHAPPNLSRM